MRCYKCGATLTASDRCPQCKADVSVYKRAAKASNAYYNLGLAKAKVRDLTGAAESLKTSVMIHKNNIEARNLLGLVYCEMGEVVEALSQWVISKNLQPDNNPAGSYIAQIQSNQGRFDAVTTTIKKYNQALNYAKEGNLDMATIQLKKNCWPESASDKGTPAFSADLYQRRRICKSQKAADVCFKN